MKAVLLSIQPQHVENICTIVEYENGEPVYKKRIDVRKTRPKLKTPFKCLIYCTSSDLHSCLMVGGGESKLIHCCNYQTAIPVGGEIGNGKVIGEFICNRIDEYLYDYCDGVDIDDDEIIETCLDREDINIYAKGKTLYGWHISDLKIYDKPKELCCLYLSNPKIECEYKKRGYNTDFCNAFKDGYTFCKMLNCDKKRVTRPPQSWCYVEV